MKIIRLKPYQVQPVTEMLAGSSGNAIPVILHVPETGDLVRVLEAGGRVIGKITLKQTVRLQGGALCCMT